MQALAKNSLFSTVLLGVFACNSSEFSGTTPNKGVRAVKPVSELIPAEQTSVAAKCGETDASKVINLDYDDRKVELRGEICPRVTGKLTVLFVVDFSGSMAVTDPQNGSGPTACGRSSAANAILKELRTSMGPNDDVRVGFVSFGDKAAIESEPLPVAEVSEDVNFCGFVTQGTNYKDAFDAATRTLQDVEGNKIVYFISDGIPSVGGNAPFDDQDQSGAHHTAGAEAAAGLRQLPNVIVNAVFLDAVGLGDANRNYLAQLTGDPERVKIAANANELADKIVELSTGEPELQQAGLVASLSAPGFPEREVKIVSFTPSGSGAWTYVTEPIELNTKSKGPVDNIFVIKTEDQKGSEFQESVTLRVAAGK